MGEYIYQVGVVLRKSTKLSVIVKDKEDTLDVTVIGAFH